MANITLQEMYDEWKKAANGIGTPSDSAQPDPTQAATIIAALKGQLERLGDLLEQMQGNGTGAMPVELTGSSVTDAQPVPVKALKVNNMIGTKASNVLITAGATVTVVPVQDVSSYTNLYAQIRPGGLTNYEVYNLIGRADNSGNLTSVLVHTGANAINVSTAPYRPGSPYCGLNIKNTMASDQMLTEAYLCGLKA